MPFIILITLAGSSAKNLIARFANYSHNCFCWYVFDSGAVAVFREEVAYDPTRLVGNRAAVYSPETFLITFNRGINFYVFSFIIFRSTRFRNIKNILLSYRLAYSSYLITSVVAVVFSVAKLFIINTGTTLTAERIRGAGGAPTQFMTFISAMFAVHMTIADLTPHQASLPIFIVAVQCEIGTAKIWEEKEFSFSSFSIKGHMLN